MSALFTSTLGKDNGGRRRLAERRRYTRSDFFPERRATRFRRCGYDRRRYPDDIHAVVREKRNAFRQPQMDRVPQ